MPTSARRWSRRQLIAGGGVLLAGAALAPRLRAQQDAALPEAARSALEQSRLVYVSPLHPDGSESRCHGEVWFFVDGSDVVLGTERGRWKARAVDKGWDRARIWVGDFGVWTRSGGKFKDAPTFLASASVDADPAVRDRALAAFGAKYPAEWDKWGPRFRRGLEDESRVLIRYRPTAP